MSDTGFDISPEEMAEINRKANEAMHAHDREQAEKRRTAMEFVASIVSKRKLKHIEEYIKEGCDYTCEFEIVDSHGGERQDETGYAFRYVYIDQYCCGGWSGDDFAGWIWIPLPQGKYLKFHYA